MKPFFLSVCCCCCVVALLTCTYFHRSQTREVHIRPHTFVLVCTREPRLSMVSSFLFSFPSFYPFRLVVMCSSKDNLKSRTKTER